MITDSQVIRWDQKADRHSKMEKDLSFFWKIRNDVAQPSVVQELLLGFIDLMMLLTKKCMIDNFWEKSG